MHNQVWLIGRLVEEPELKTLEGDRRSLVMNLAVQRGYKNEDGIYDVDYIRCCLWNIIAANTAEYCHKGDLIGIRGRIQTRSYMVDEDTRWITEIVVDKVTFLASSSRREHEIE